MELVSFTVYDNEERYKCISCAQRVINFIVNIKRGYISWCTISSGIISIVLSRICKLEAI